MKRPLINQFCGGVMALLLAGSALAQDTTQRGQQDTSMKTLEPVTIYSSTKVAPKVEQAFATSFKEAVDPKWYQLNKNYLVNFMMHDQRNSALFKKNGYLIYHISYGNEQSLPEDVRRIIKSNYVDYNITQAVNVKQDNRDIWVINLESPKKLLLVRVENGAIEEVGDYKKSG